MLKAKLTEINIILSVLPTHFKNNNFPVYYRRGANVDQLQYEHLYKKISYKTKEKQGNGSCNNSAYKQSFICFRFFVLGFSIFPKPIKIIFMDRNR